MSSCPSRLRSLSLSLYIYIYTHTYVHVRIHAQQSVPCLAGRESSSWWKQRLVRSPMQARGIIAETLSWQGHRGSKATQEVMTCMCMICSMLYSCHYHYDS